MQLSKDIVQDVFEEGLLVVFCGTALGNRSAANGHYYAHASNCFWRVLHECGLTPGDAPLKPSECFRVGEFGIGLTDLCKEHSGNDDQLPKGALRKNTLADKIAIFRPRVLAFTSKNAGRAWGGSKVEFGWQQSPYPATRIYVLPSTSIRARRNWAANRHHWQALAEAVKGISNPSA